MVRGMGDRIAVEAPMTSGPAGMIQDVSPGAFRTYHALHHYAANEGNAAPYRGDLAYMLGVSRTTVSRYIQELQAGGWVVVESRVTPDGYTLGNLYVLPHHLSDPRVAGAVERAREESNEHVNQVL